MTDSNNLLIAVFGATGQQGGSVIRALGAHGGFRVRAITRDRAKAEGLADEVVEADLTKSETLAAAVDGAHHNEPSYEWLKNTPFSDKE